MMLFEFLFVLIYVDILGDVTTITLITVFATLYIAFFIIFPGIRKEV